MQEKDTPVAARRFYASANQPAPRVFRWEFCAYVGSLMSLFSSSASKTLSYFSRRISRLERSVFTRFTKSLKSGFIVSLFIASQSRYSLGEGVEAVEENELAPLPAVEDFRRRARRVAAQMGREEDIGVQHGTERTGHLQTGGNVLMRLAKLGERLIRVEPCGLVQLRLAHGLGHDLPRLRAVPLAADRLQPGFMPEIKRDTEIQVGDAGHPGLHVGGDVEGDAHGSRSVAVQVRRCNSLRQLSALALFLRRRLDLRLASRIKLSYPNGEAIAFECDTGEVVQFVGSRCSRTGVEEILGYDLRVQKYFAHQILPTK